MKRYMVLDFFYFDTVFEFDNFEEALRYFNSQKEFKYSNEHIKLIEYTILEEI